MTSKRLLGLVLVVAGCGSSGGTTDGGAPQIDAAARVADAPVVVVTPDAPRAQPDAVPQPDAAAALCGTCPAGTHCGTANTIPVCKDDGTEIPRFSHVFVIMMENMSYTTLMGNADVAPYLAGLTATSAFSTNYHGVLHPSLPNYLALTSGQSIDLGCDCQPTGAACNSGTCNGFAGTCGCPQTVNNIGDQLETAQKNWKNYAEDMGTSCNVTAAAAYAPKHIPFLYYTSIQGNASRCSAHVVDYSSFAVDAAANMVPEFTFITPNLNDDGHDPITGGDTNAMNADDWLKTNVPKITALDAYKNGGAIFIVWDEDDYSGLIHADDPVPMFVISPYAKKGYGSTTMYNHFDMLATWEDGLGLPRLGSAVGVAPLTDFFAEH